MTEVTPASEASRVLDGIDTVMCDCDGVLWRGGNLLENTNETIHYLRDQGKRVIFVTNNSSKSRRMYADKFATLGVDVEPECISSSAFATARYLSHNLPTGSKVYVIGQKGLFEELKEVGLTPVGGKVDDPHAVTPFEVDQEIRAVVVGFDWEMNYRKFSYAMHCVRSIPGCLFIGTNRDVCLPVPGMFLPGTGAALAFMETCTERTAITMGKPEKIIFEALQEVFPDIKPERTLMIGDRIDTDIVFGLNNGCRTALVLTGVTHANDVPSIPSGQRPHFVLEGFKDLYPADA